MLCTAVAQIYSPDPVALSEFSSYGYFVVWIPVKWESFIHSVYGVSVTLFFPLLPPPHILINGGLPRECNRREMKSRRPGSLSCLSPPRGRILSPLRVSRLWVLRSRVHVLSTHTHTHTHVYTETRRMQTVLLSRSTIFSSQLAVRAPFTHRNFSFPFHPSSRCPSPPPLPSLLLAPFCLNIGVSPFSAASS